MFFSQAFQQIIRQTVSVKSYRDLADDSSAENDYSLGGAIPMGGDDEIEDDGNNDTPEHAAVVSRRWGVIKTGDGDRNMVTKYIINHKVKSTHRILADDTPTSRDIFEPFLQNLKQGISEPHSRQVVNPCTFEGQGCAGKYAPE
jgi:hypothetical protein